MPLASMRTGTRLLVFFLLGAVALPAFAQRPGQRPGQMRGGAILGTVVDADTGQPIELATAAVWSARDSSLVTGALTDAAGAFDIRPLRPGTYYLKLTYVGYVPQTIPDLALSPANRVADLGTVELVPDAALLDGVQVEGVRDDIEVQVDRTVFNTADQIVADVGSLTDLLRNVPAIEVDIDGNVSLRGNQNVAIQINGRPVPISGAFLATYLQQIPAASVERIEVIPNPSAKYDPEGLGGIVNIILKENTDLGLSGGLVAGVETIGGYNASGNLNYQKGKWTTFLSYGLRRNVRESGGTNTFDFFLVDDPTRRQLDARFTDDDGEDDGFGHVLNGSVDYKLTPKSTLSLAALANVGAEGENEVNFRRATFDDGDVVESYRLSDESEDNLNADVALTYARVVQRSTDELTAEVRYTADARDDVSFYTEGFAFVDGAVPAPTAVERNTSDRFTQEGSLQLDWVKPVAGFGIEAGYRGELLRITDDFLVEDQDLATGAFARNDALTNSFTFDQQVHAVYGLAERSFGALSLKGGVRLEQAFTSFDLDQSVDEPFENNYFSVFPSAFATYQLAEGTSLKASYSRRINRPRTRVLNPFENREDPLNVRVGNPALRPEYTDSFEAGVTWFTPKTTLTLTPFYRRTTDSITRFTLPTDEEGVRRRTFVNLDTQENYGVETIGSVRFGQRFSSFVNVSAYQSQTSGESVEADLGADGFEWSVRGNLSYSFPSGTAVQFFGFYRAPREIPQGRLEAFSFTNLAIRQRLLDDRASVAVAVGDVFDTAGFEYAIADDFGAQVGERRWQARFVTFTVNYTFGQQPQRRPDQRQRGGQSGDEGMDF